MSINFLEHPISITREFTYYNIDGVYIGKSNGQKPDEDLFNKAHYVFNDQSDIVKNLDLLQNLRRKLNDIRRELIQTPLKKMSRILELNQQIELIKNSITDLEQT